ncbi:MAG: hydrogenase expression/formation protein HypE [Legionellales bacterium]|nr:hydrogenase expression/formation protein HypE [Legionellales bacterium]
MTSNILLDLSRKTGVKLNIKQGRVEMTHGAGGRAMQQLIEQLFFPVFNNPFLSQRQDQACFAVAAGRMVMTTDCHVVTPLFFPGGDIGSLAVNGTINDIVMSGAIPLYLSAGFILEEGFPLIDLQKIAHSMAKAAERASVYIITGDTKVVEKGKCDGVFITTTGIGCVPENVSINQQRPQAGDKIILSGQIGDHGVAVMSQRHNLGFETQVISDSAALHDLVKVMVAIDPAIRCMRDPTRGGVAAVLNEWAHEYQIGMQIDEAKIPVQNAVRGACELLGLDPLVVANEGKLLAICSSASAANVLASMQEHPQGKQAAIIGEVRNDPDCFVRLQTIFGGQRRVDWLVGEQLPRIC